ncbi:hypothetical protein FB451DRAFT_311308 [Mycena latifolia]|nr:hypothetical protein FB451DRAFT_311308 [Mycena latifolia]
MTGEPLNPGGPARKRGSFRKCSLWTCLIIFGLLVAMVVVAIGKALYKVTQFSHSHVFQNQTLEEVKNRGAVVRPLIDENQSFDIAVSIWSLPVEEHGETIEDFAEEPLYSDIVFRGLRLADKHKRANITYQLPVRVFRRLQLKERDLRASFVAIPTSPSLVDYVTNFSTWRPETMKVPPVRAWPFPLGTSDETTQNVVDRALDSFGISIPLLEFHEIRSKCANDSNSDISPDPVEEKEDDVDEDGADGDEDEAEDESDEVKDNDADSPGISNIEKNPDHAVKRHPFVVTRTQIRIVDEVHIFNRKAYNKEHDKLRTTSCGQILKVKPQHNFCGRSYTKNGNWETRLELQIPDEITGELRTEWAYAPYIGHGTFSSGTKDLIPVPVMREDCTRSETLTDPDSMEVTWHLSYSGRTPAKFTFTESARRLNRVGHHESDLKKAKAQDSAELMNGLYGHQFYEDAHPRRRFIIGGLTSVLSIILTILELGYWNTRASTVCISISGTVLIAFSNIISSTAKIEKSDLSNLDFLQRLLTILLALVTGFSLPFFTLKAITRLEISRNKSRWFPSVRLAPPTHEERNSQRLDSRTGWGVKAVVCISLIAIFYFFSPANYVVVSPRLPAPSPDDYNTTRGVVARVSDVVYFPLEFTGIVSQLLLNQRSKMFAGSYKIAAILRYISMMLVLTVFSPSIVGRYDARPGISVPDAVVMVVIAVRAWQAVTLPNVNQQAEDEDSE